MRNREVKGKFKTTMDTSLEGILETADEIANMFTCKPNELDPDVPILTASEYEALDLGKCFVETECNNGLLGGVLDFYTFQSQQWFNIEDISDNIEYDKINLDTDVLYPNLTGQEMSQEFLDRILQRADNSVPHGKISQPAEAKHSDKVFKLDCSPDSCLRNVGLESHSPGPYKGDSGAERSYLSCASTPRLGSKDNHNSFLLDHTSVQEQQEAFRSIFGYETLVTDTKWTNHCILLGSQNYLEINNRSNLEEYSVISDKNEEKTMSLSSSEFFGSATGSIKGELSNEIMTRDLQVKRKKLSDDESLKTSNPRVSEVELCSMEGQDKLGAFSREKRSRQPPRRYIEEPLDYESKFYRTKCGVASKRPKNSFLHVRSDKNNLHKEIQAETLLCKDKSFEVGCIQVPFGLPVETRQLEEDHSSLVQDSEDLKEHRLLGSSEKFEVESSPAESQEDISEDECVSRRYTKKRSKRKNHYITWTSSEVMKLIEGVSQCGVGRWTEIKNLQFSSCSHRTSVDIKDKWRNLLKASRTQLQNRRKVKRGGEKKGSHQAPESVLQRVRELAAICPYPRESRFTCNTPMSSFSTIKSNALPPCQLLLEG